MDKAASQQAPPFISVNNITAADGAGVVSNFNVPAPDKLVEIYLILVGKNAAVQKHNQVEANEGNSDGRPGGFEQGIPNGFTTVPGRWDAFHHPQRRRCRHGNRPIRAQPFQQAGIFQDFAAFRGQQVALALALNPVGQAQQACQAETVQVGIDGGAGHAGLLSIIGWIPGLRRGGLTFAQEDFQKLVGLAGHRSVIIGWFRMTDSLAQRIGEW